MEHIQELEAPLPLLTALCDQAKLDPRQRALVLTGKRSLQISQTAAVVLAGSENDGLLGAAGGKTQGPRDMVDLIADRLEVEGW